MGLATLSVTTDTIGTAVSASRLLDPGFLYSAVTSVPANDNPKGSIIVRLDIHRGGPDPMFAGASLIHEYIYANYWPSWTGSLLIEPNDLIVLTGIGTFMRSIRAALMISKFRTLEFSGVAPLTIQH